MLREGDDTARSRDGLVDALIFSGDHSTVMVSENLLEARRRRLTKAWKRRLSETVKQADGTGPEEPADQRFRVW